MLQSDFEPKTNVPADAALVLAATAGDRGAFENLVARYQALVCSITYSGTGDFCESEDLAQETFVTAWRQLATLREPEKVKSWLCGIARNLTSSSRRKRARDPLNRPVCVTAAADRPAEQRVPSEEVMTAEESRVVWQSLQNIPEQYREPMVLFYRQNQSVEKVSEELGLSREAVKQRLARGRRMLQEEVASVVENALRRSTPGKAFTLAVMAGLPALVTSASAATIGVTAAKAAVAKTAGAATLASLGAWVGPLGGVLGGVWGAKCSIENTKSPRERAFVKKVAWASGVVAVLFCVAQAFFVLNAAKWAKAHPVLLSVGAAGVLLSYGALLLVFIRYANKRQLKIRAEDDLEPSQNSAPAGYEFCSKARLFGMPLVHVRLGNALGTGRAAAKGWIAIGDTAFGVLFAFGGISVGGIAIGGLACGLLPVGGMALGVWAIGGCAVGFEALGGGAFAWHAALGGAAFARDYAQGGMALATHANDAAAVAFFRSRGFFMLQSLLQMGSWMLLLPICAVPLIARRNRQRLRKDRAPRQGT